MKHTTLVLIASAIGACSTASAAWAVSSSYSTTHNYSFFLPNVTVPPVATLSYTLNASAYEPLPGWDVRTRNGASAVLGTGTFATAERAGTDRPTPLFTDAGATANVSASVGTWGGGLFSASMNASGSAHANFVPNRATASSSMASTLFRAGWNWRTGRLTWQPVLSDFVAGSSSAVGAARRVVRNRDPIMLYGLLPDGSVDPVNIESFFDVFLELSDDGSWDNTGFHAADTSGVLDMKLSIVRESPYVAGPPGRLELEVTSGVVTSALATGPFASVGLPSLGTTVGGVLDLPTLGNEFVFDYDLTPMGEREFMFELSGGGSIVVPEPTLFVLAGLTFIARRPGRTS